MIYYSFRAYNSESFHVVTDLFKHYYKHVSLFQLIIAHSFSSAPGRLVFCLSLGVFLFWIFHGGGIVKM